MSVEITTVYLGNKKSKVQHGPSGSEIITVPPKDNMGDGSSFSPTDLVAAGLGACMMSLIAIVAERDGIDISGTHSRVEKHMSNAPRRIGRLPVYIHLPKTLTAPERQKLEHAALTCPVHHSLHPDVERPVEFIYDVG